MKYLPVVVCCHWVLFTASLVLGREAQDCALYEGHVSSKTSPTKTMHRRLSTGVLQKGGQFAATLSLTSRVSNESCHINILSNTIAVSCSVGMEIYKWSPAIFKEQDITELWIHVGSLGGPEEEKDVGSSTDLALIGRRGFHRGHIMFPSSGLEPPISVIWKPIQYMEYYFNCVTGCLYIESAVTSSGMHSFFFRPRQDFSHLYITYNSTEYRTLYEMSLNSSDFSIDGQWKKMTVVWNKKDGGIGMLVDDQPIKGLESYSNLDKKSIIEAEIRGGGGYLSLCDQRFKDVADARNGEESFNESAMISSPTSQNLQGYDVSKNWLVVLALVCIALLLFVAITLVILLLKTKRDLQREQDVSARNDIAVETFGGPRMATAKSSAPLYPDAHSGRDSIISVTPAKGSKGQAPSVPGSNTNPYTSNGSNT